MWWMYALGSAVFAALTAVFAKTGIKGVDSNLAVAIRTVVILIMAWVVVLVRGSASSFNLLSKQNLIFIGLSGITTGLSWIFYFKALEKGNLAQVAPVDKLSLALTIIFAVIFLGETLSVKTAIGAACILAGTVIIIL